MIPTCIKTLGGQTSRRNITSFFKKSNYATEASFDTKPCRLHKLEHGPSTKVNVTKEDAIEYYTQLHTIRRMETAAGNLYKEKIIRGFCHLYSGQEAIAVGIMAALRKNLDSVITAYRAHGWTYLMGVKPAGVLAELTGKQSGVSRGKGGSMHLYTERFYGGNGIVGAQVDGMDVLAVREAARFAVDHCTSGKGPIVMEAATYRYSGHSMSDPGTSYRTREEIQEVRQTRDPITGFKDRIVNANLVTSDELKKIETVIRKEIDDAVKLAKADKEIPLSELTTDVYSKNLESEVRNCTPFNPLSHSTLGKAFNL
ncbi:pyruvate dehydrogenase E1 component subunit alpha type I, mitochondrial-like isoform X2 [Belonocnema kinseyi]|uniref:pyruvate dehydrogenase E1 component subunit alpha type I, mitochondrial-like isoform X2 n=1 Tax=Belonocnema kinseyi TaxID=2817044 RepID=UPI00143CE91A|nr:pyruvate dehydrogenase E1 component subunit alpha type I, mitochondrial-like isoform X2 [Belonocnema kinseyi]